LPSDAITDGDIFEAEISALIFGSRVEPSLARACTTISARRGSLPTPKLSIRFWLDPICTLCKSVAYRPDAVVEHDAGVCHNERRRVMAVHP